MFDTVVIKANNVHIDLELIKKLNTDKPHTYVIHDTGEIATTYKLHDEQLPYIKYNDGFHTLIIQVSIPNFLYGNNVILITEEDIPIFFNRLQQRLYELFSITISHDEWTAERTDICWNFQVGNKVTDYMNMLSKQKLPRRNTLTYNHIETVYFKNGTSQLKFYDKEKERIKKKASAELIEQSKGILRLEIEPSNKEMRKFSPTRKAIELLNPTFFTYMVERFLSQIEYPVTAETIDLSWLLEHKKDISKIETLLAFQFLQQHYNETTLSNLYQYSTYNNRKKLAKKMTIPRGNCLEPLAISQ